jgi:hypothetical protein
MSTKTSEIRHYYQRSTAYSIFFTIAQNFCYKGTHKVISDILMSFISFYINAKEQILH